MLAKIFQANEMAKIEKIAKKVEAEYERIKNQTDDHIRSQAKAFQKRLANGESLDSILPEAFATAMVACERKLGMVPRHVQIVGAIAMHQGKIAQMATGEGKTMTIVLPAYLNALTGKGVHVLTANPYLAKRDSEKMAPVYQALGLTVGNACIDQNEIIEKYRNNKMYETIQSKEAAVSREYIEKKQRAYAASVTYCTGSEAGFDFLRDQNTRNVEEKLQVKGQPFAIVDEADNIFIDEAQIPLILSAGSVKVNPKEFAEYVDLLNKINDFVITQIIQPLNKEYKEFDEGKRSEPPKQRIEVYPETDEVLLSEYGFEIAMEYFGISENEIDKLNFVQTQINCALQAHTMNKGVHYLVENGKIVVIDQNTNRAAAGRAFSTELHQALEVKEGLAVSQPMVNNSQISFANLFAQYDKVCGATGTATQSEEEFRENYKKEIVEVPTFKPVARDDQMDRLYATREEKLAAVVEEVRQCHAKGQPILIGTTSVGASRELAQMLVNAGIECVVLNAENEKDENAVVAQAGRFGAVTVATNMAGRGTDIKLGGDWEEYGDISKEDARLDAVVGEILDYNAPQNQNDNKPTKYRISDVKRPVVVEAGSKGGLSKLKEKLRAANIEFVEVSQRTQFKNEAERAKFLQQEQLKIAEAIISGKVVVGINIDKCEHIANLIKGHKLIEKDWPMNEKKRVLAVGGLRVIGTEHHESKRVDDQLRGRSGRQGDVGSSCFFVSLEDELFRNAADDDQEKKLRALCEDKKPSQEDKAKRQQIINDVQEHADSQKRAMRKEVIICDNILNAQREKFFAHRNVLIESSDGAKIMLSLVPAIVDGIIDNVCDRGKWDEEKLEEVLKSGIFRNGKFTLEDAFKYGHTERAVSEALVEIATAHIKENFAYLQESKSVQEGVDSICTRNLINRLDSGWKNHLQSIGIVQAQAYVNAHFQLDPHSEYGRTSAQMFNRMVIDAEQQAIADVLAFSREAKRKDASRTTSSQRN